MPSFSPRKSAAQSILEQMGAGGGAMPEEGLPSMGEEEAPLPDEAAGMVPPASDQGMDLESALAGVEAALPGLPEDAAKEIRTHLEAIRDIASREPGMADSANETDIQDDMPPPPDSTMPPEAPDSGLEKLPL